MIEIIAGLSVYMTRAFKDFWGDHYSTVPKMRKSVATLKASPKIDLPTLQYGQYQPVLAPLDQWEKFGSKYWAKEVGRARLHLTEQSNSQPLSRDEPHVVPLTRCALLDAALRKCFNSEPPIPIDVLVKQQPKDAPTARTHTLELRWTYANGDDKPPTCLHYSMICPYRPHLAQAGDIAKAFGVEPALAD
jgi:hypothetical protein